MASLSRSRYGVYALAFRYDGTRFHRSLRTKSSTVANRLKGSVEVALDKLYAGLLPTPANMTADQLWRILITGSSNHKRPEITKRVTLESITEEYLGSYGWGTKEDSTIETESHHLNHLRRLLGPETSLSEVNSANLRDYVKTRQTEPGRHGKTISPVTISKELATFRQLWEFARGENLVSGDNPLGSVRKPRPEDKPRFMTRAEIERAIGRGGLDVADIAKFWECLFLSEQEIGSFLRHVKVRCAQLPRFRYIYAALSFCAYTGCRRSEMFRAQHFDIEGPSIQIREKKRSQRVTYSFRQVPMHPNLKLILDELLQDHPGGQFLFCKNNLAPLCDKVSREAFDAVTTKSEWSILRGYHILRHSFASNLAHKGVDQRLIDEFIGHQTEASRRRYRHLFPEQLHSAISVLNFDSTSSSEPQ